MAVRARPRRPRSCATTSPGSRSPRRGRSPRRPGRPGLRLPARRRDGAARRPRSARRACSRSSTRRAGRTAARRRATRRSTPTTTASSAASSPGATRARYTPPGALLPLPAVKNFTVWNEPNRGQYLLPQGPGGLTAARTFARPRARLRRRRARRLAGRARRRRADREPRRAGRRGADRVPRRLPQGRRPAAAGARVQPVHERPGARLTSRTRRRPTARSRCATSTSSSTG